MIDKRDPEQLYLAIKAEQVRTGCSILTAADRVQSSAPGQNGASPSDGLAPQPPTERSSYGPVPCN